MSLTRRFIRETIFKILFYLEFLDVFKYQKKKYKEFILNYLENFVELDKIDSIINDEYYIKMIDGMYDKYKYLRDIIVKYAPSWPIDNISEIDRSILYIGIYEILFVDSVPEIVSINEGVEIAKKYGSDNSSKFINGLLNSVMRKEK